MKKVIIGLIIFIVILLIAIMGFKQFFPKKTDEIELIPTPTVVLPTISEDVSVELIPQNNNQVVVLKIGNLPSNMVVVEYELIYVTSDDLPRGVLGKINLAGEKEIERSDIVLGTCSSGRCVYDKGVKSINLSLKFTDSSGQNYIFQKTYDFES